MTTQKGKPLGVRNGIKIYKGLKIKSHLKSNKPIKKTTNRTLIKRQKEVTLKKKLLERCKGLCEDCGKLPDWRGLSKHEIIFRSHGGNTLDENNCLMLCGKCHSKRHGIIEK